MSIRRGYYLQQMAIIAVEVVTVNAFIVPPH